MTSSKLQIIISSGMEDPKATLGFATATAASACGTQVVVFLVMQGVHWALKSAGNEPQQPGFQTIAQMLTLLQDSGSTIEVCSSCIHGICAAGSDQGWATAPDQKITEGIREGIRVGGLAAVAVRMSQMPTVAF